jgi:hypothetical protein
MSSGKVPHAFSAAHDDGGGRGVRGGQRQSRARALQAHQPRTRGKVVKGWREKLQRERAEEALTKQFVRLVCRPLLLGTRPDSCSAALFHCPFPVRPRLRGSCAGAFLLEHEDQNAGHCIDRLLRAYDVSQREARCVCVRVRFLACGAGRVVTRNALL